MSHELPPSFEQLYLAYSRLLSRWAYRLLHHHETAEEVTRETFLRAWRYLGTFDPARGALSSRTRRITVQVTSDQVGYRKGRLATISLDNLPWEVHGPEAADPQTRYAGSAQPVAAALGSFPHNERIALAMHASGYRESEIARHIGKTSRTVRTWRALGRIHLLQVVEGER